VAHGDLVPRQSIRTLELDHGRLHAVRAQTPPNGTFSDHLPQGVG
jgi:hypothetical protein